MKFMDFSFTSALFGTADAQDAVNKDGEATCSETALSPTADTVDMSPSNANSSLETTAEGTPGSRKYFTKQTRPLQASLPSSWYSSENFFALEVRAIFSQVSLPITNHNINC